MVFPTQETFLDGTRIFLLYAENLLQQKVCRDEYKQWLQETGDGLWA